MRKDVSPMEVQMYADITAACDLLQVITEEDDPELKSRLTDRIYTRLGGTRDMFSEDLWVSD